ncbi:MAG: hypothetical protein KDA22_11070, partial [Phycisphaerales bacterium]|nr:hypothetical protein [Phycisphaerales bacterium]
MRRMTGLIIGLVLGLGAAAHGADEEHWYVILLQGQKAGWMMERSTTGDDGKITSETEMRLKIGRGAQAVELSMGSEFVERGDGTAVSALSRQKQGQMQMTREYKFSPEKVIERVVQGEEGDADAR